MSCLENEKISCCTKLYTKKTSFDNIEKQLVDTLEIVPLICEKVCPEDCEVSIFDPNESNNQYITTIEDSCESCEKSIGCETNYSLFFDKSTCSFTETLVSSLTAAQELQNDNLKLVLYIDCLSVFLSKASASRYTSITTQELSKYNECNKPCCYLLEDGRVGCIKIPTKYCNKDLLSKAFRSNVEQASVDSVADDCSNSSCFGQPITIDIPESEDNSRCGACCIDNNCLMICDTDASLLDFYSQFILKINDKDFVKINFANRVGNITAPEICKALQGKFLRYNTSCGPKTCNKESIIIR